MSLEGDYLFDLEEEIGTVLSAEELCPGVYRVNADPGGYVMREHLVVLDTAPISGKVRNYGKKMDGLRLYATEDDSSGWRVVQYEASKYGITVQGRAQPEWLFRDMSLRAMELHPEYFGPFPPPFHTPCGATLRCRTLANGIYWLETSMCRELLAVCHPVWSRELSFAAIMLCEEPVRLIASVQEKATDYIFFSKEVSSVPVYELMESREDWDGTVIDCPALMNAVWECMPRYALHVNGERDPEFETEVAALMTDFGLMKALPHPDGKHIIGMYPGAGTDFLLLK